MSSNERPKARGSRRALHKGRASGQLAITLAEVLVSLAILCLVSAFEISMFASGSRMPVHVQERMAVTEQTRAYLEDFIDSAPVIPLGSQSGTLPTGYLAGYSYNMMVANSTFDPMVYDITMTVTAPGSGLTQTFRTLKRSSTPSPGLALMFANGCFNCHQLASGPAYPPGPGGGPPLNKSNLQALANLYGIDVQTLVTARLNNPNEYVTAGYTTPSVMPCYTSQITAVDQSAIANYLYASAPP